MIEGITILNEMPIYTASGIQYILCIALFICLMFTAVIIIKDGYQFEKVFYILLLSFLISFVSIGVIRPTLSYIKYEVTINDNVKFTEFDDKYKVIEKRGAIYTIKERD
mgnify:CR=1 FL=1